MQVFDSVRRALRGLARKGWETHHFLYAAPFMIGSRKHFETAAEALICRASPGRSGTLRDARGIAARDVQFTAKEFGRRLYASIASDTYVAPPVTAHWANLDKRRLLFSFALSEQVIHSTAAQETAARAEQFLSPHLYSYRKGRGPAQALRALGDYARRHSASRPEPKSRGLFVLRRDIRQYTDSISLTENSPLWRILKSRGIVDEKSLKQIKTLVRCVVQEEGAQWQLFHGLPTGSALTPVIGNIFLSLVDELFESVDGFYARYGDDFVFASPSEATVQDVLLKLDFALKELGLEINLPKARNFYWTGAGGILPTRAKFSWTATESVTFLGQQVHFRGTVSLGKSKQRLFLREVEVRARNAARLLSSESFEIRARAVVGAINRLLNLQSPLMFRHIPTLLGATDDRSQLRALDYSVALRCAQAATGLQGPRAFRKLPWAKLIQDFGLISLTAQRNRA